MHYSKRLNLHTIRMKRTLLTLSLILTFQQFLFSNPEKFFNTIVAGIEADPDWLFEIQKCPAEIFPKKEVAIRYDPNDCKEDALDCLNKMQRR